MEAALFGFLFPSVGGFGRALHCAALLAGFWIVLLMIASIAWLLPLIAFWWQRTAAAAAAANRTSS